MVRSKLLPLDIIEGKGKCISIFLKKPRIIFCQTLSKKEKLEFQKYFQTNKI